MSQKPLICHILIAFHSIWLFSQQTRQVDFKTADAQLHINPYKKEVTGTVTYTFKPLQQTDSVFLDARNMTFSEVLLNNAPVQFHNSGKKIFVIHPFIPKKTYYLRVTYRVNPTSAMYFMGWEYPNANRQVWTQGQGKYTSHWLPSFDDVNEKLIFNTRFSIVVKEDTRRLQAAGNGKLMQTLYTDSLVTWQFRMKHPMSSYLAAIAIGEYAQKTVFSRRGIPIHLYYYPQDTLYVEPTYRYAQTIFDFLEKELGVPYPWENYKQIPVRDFLYAGMENTTATIFSDSYVIDSTAFADWNYVNVQAHELAHQWFGNLVTAQNGLHHWLQEGFATYYALLAEQAVFGTDYYYEQLYHSAEALIEQSRQGKGERVLDSAAGSLTFYEKGSWVLHALRERTGDAAFKKAIRKYLQKYRFKTATTANFIEEIERTSGENLVHFRRTWLENPLFPEEEALQSLRKNPALKKLLTLKETESIDTLLAEFSTTNPSFLNKEIITRCKGNYSADVLTLFRQILSGHLPRERQAVAMTLDSIPPELKEGFESLLQDKSYLTIETALYKLWRQFPAYRESYLNQTKDLWGLPAGNIRMLWLSLALLTPGYEEESQRNFYDELSSYTAPFHSYEIREPAFEYLYELKALSQENLKDLLDACFHPAGEFAAKARRLLDALLADPAYKIRLRAISYSLGGQERNFLQEKMKE